MKIRYLPEFILGIHYRELSPQEGKNRFRWETLQDIHLVHNERLTAVGVIINFKDKLGKIWLTFKDYVAILRKGYAWNGCSPKVHVPFIGWIGTPDHPKTRLASAFHDAGCQFELTKHMPLNRKEIDVIFYDIMKLSGYLFRGLFHGAIRKFGPLFGTSQDVYSEYYSELDLGV